MRKKSELFLGGIVFGLPRPVTCIHLLSFLRNIVEKFLVEWESKVETEILFGYPTGVPNIIYAENEADA